MEADDGNKKNSLESIPDSLHATPAPGNGIPDLEKSPQAELDPNDLGPPPDGGFEAWLVVAGGFCTVFASFGWINCVKIPLFNFRH